MEITMHFLVLRKKLVLYFASIKKEVTIIINFENIVDDNALFGKVKKIFNFRNLFDKAIGLRMLEIQILKFSRGGGGMPADPTSASRVGRSLKFLVS